MIVLQLREKLPKNSTSAVPWSFSIWSKLERWKSLINGKSCELTSNQNNRHFLLFYETINEPFLDRIVTCDESGFYMTPSNNQFSDWTEKKLQVQFSCSVMSDSLRPHGLQHARVPCPSSTPGAWSNSCPSSGWCHPTISSCRPLLLLPSIFPSIRIFSNESALRMRWPKYWSFSFNISPFNELRTGFL